MAAEAEPVPCCAGLTPQQVQALLWELPAARVSHDDKGHVALEHWDVRRTLIRIFGFAGYDIDDDDPVLVKEIPLGTADSGKTRWTVVYRAKTRLTVKCVHGRAIGHWDGTAAEGAMNQPTLAQAHDLAMKSAASQALKRAAINLGDQFGLCLYNDGQRGAVVNASAAYMENLDSVVANDAPVRPEPDSADEGSQEVPEQPAPAQQAPPARPQWQPPRPCANAQEYPAWVKAMKTAYRKAPTVPALEALRALLKKAKADGFLTNDDRQQFLIDDQTRAAEIADLDRAAQDHRKSA
jgi:hypothetical protein